MDLDLVLFAGITLRQVLYVVGGLIVLGAVLNLLKKKPNDPQHLVQKRCNACRWTGQVSKFNTKCPKCGKAIG